MLFRSIKKEIADLKGEGGGAGGTATLGPTSSMGSYLRKVAQVESGGKGGEKAGTSSAAGLFQFTEGTWNQTVKEMGNGQYQVTFLLTQANKRKFVLPYKEGERPTYYEGPVEDKTVMMNQEELADLIVPPFEMVKQGLGAPPAGGGMGGMPPGGAPPGNPMAGGMPPMGGM